MSERSVRKLRWNAVAKWVVPPALVMFILRGCRLRMPGSSSFRVSRHGRYRASACLLVVYWPSCDSARWDRGCLGPACQGSGWAREATDPGTPAGQRIGKLRAEPKRPSRVDHAGPATGDHLALPGGPGPRGRGSRGEDRAVRSRWMIAPELVMNSSLKGIGGTSNPRPGRQTIVIRDARGPIGLQIASNSPDT